MAHPVPRGDMMHRLWFITNPGSGTATQAKCDAIEAAFRERGVDLVGRTGFPEDALPTATQLDEHRVDTVILFAGDGTINATLDALRDWQGKFLILPGGTMNLLAKGLHDTLDPGEIITAAYRRSATVALPFVEAGPNRAYVGLILGPAAHWFRAREEVRKRRFARLWRVARHAWTRTFGRGLRIVGVPGLRRGYQAVFAHPDPHGIELSGIDARDWRSIIELGWTFASGEWATAAPVTRVIVAQFTLGGSKPVLGLFDGEPVTLDPGTRIGCGISAQIFIDTRKEDM